MSLIPTQGQWVERIWHCQSCSVGGSDSVPGLGTSTCHRCDQKKKRKQKTSISIPQTMVFYILGFLKFSPTSSSTERSSYHCVPMVLCTLIMPFVTFYNNLFIYLSPPDCKVFIFYSFLLSLKRETLALFHNYTGKFPYFTTMTNASSRLRENHLLFK